jgi:hypothetical protein
VGVSKVDFPGSLTPVNVRRVAHSRAGLARLVAGVVGLIVVPGVLVPQEAHGTFPGRDGLIALGGGGYWFKCRHLNVHVIRPDGSGLRSLTPLRQMRARLGMGPGLVGRRWSSRVSR